MVGPSICDCLTAYQAHSSEIFSIAVTASRAVTASGDSSIKIWDVKAQEHPLAHTFENAHRLGAHHVVVNIENGATVAASSGFGQELVAWDLENGKEIVRRTASGTVFKNTILIRRLFRKFNNRWFIKPSSGNLIL